VTVEAWELPPPTLPAWLERALPYRRRSARVGGYAMHFIDEGSGPPVLLVHGNPTWSYLWRDVIRDLVSRGYRVVAPDLIGLGLSDKPRRVSDHSVALHVQTICELVEHLDLSGLTIVGQDWGGPIVAGFAARRPQRVAAAVFANTAILAPGSRYRVTRFHQFSHIPVLSDLAFRGLKFPIPMMGKVQGDPASLNRSRRRAYHYPLRRFRDRAAPLALARLVPDGPDHPSLPVLQECEAWARSFEGPVGLVWGLRDPILGGALRRMRGVFPGAQVTETQAGHFLQEEVPEALAAGIDDVAREAQGSR
jgi:cis-3-alkyl-4-acyloxetan-2-one decarboxylase